MTHRAADLLVDRLVEWGVRVVFGLPGDGINGVMEALREQRERITFVQVRHEEAAAFMACGYAKYTGELGVCLATSGPGAVHLLNGLYDAKLDGAPVLALTGQTYDVRGMHDQQEFDLLSLFKDVAPFNQQVTGAAHVHTLVDAACRSALSRRGVAHITFPIDLQVQRVGRESRSTRAVTDQTSPIWQPPTVVPSAPDLAAAARTLNAGHRTVILAGRGALGAADELEQIADALAAPIVKPLLGKAAVPDDSPFTTGGIGLLGTEASELAMEQADTLLMIGTSFPYTEYYPDHDRCRGVQIDRDAARIGLHFPVEIGLCGDAKATAQLLLPLLERRDDRSFLIKAQEGMETWRALLRRRVDRDDVPMKPQLLAGTLSDLLADDAIISTDSGTITIWAARHVQVRRKQMFSCSGHLATGAQGLPYAIAAQIAFPGRQSVAFVGDGGFTMLMGEFATAVRYGLPIKVVVVKNHLLDLIKWEQPGTLANPEHGLALEPIDFVKFAEACGGVGFRCERPDEARSALEALLLAEGPALCEAVVDPFEPPMRPSAAATQTFHVTETESGLNEEPKLARDAATFVYQKLHDLTSHKK